MNRYYPTLKDIIYNTLAIIHNCEVIKTPIVESPIPDINGIVQKIPIDRYRNYDGMELQEPGLTLSIFPRFSPSEKPYGGQLATEYKPTSLGKKDNSFLYEVTYHLVVQLAYTGVSLNEQKQLVYVKDKHNNISSNKDYLLDSAKDPFPKTDIVPIEINVAEDVLRDYLEIIRVILESIDTFVPWSLRSSVVTGMSFPTTSWSQESEQIYFHKASLNWEIYSYAPCSYQEQQKVRGLEIISKKQIT